MTTVTKTSIQDKIRSVYYLNAGQALSMMDKIDETDKANLSLVTICIIILENGFKVEGVSACVDPSNFDANIGKEEAYKNAFDKIWEIEGYLLKQKMFEENQK